MQIPHARRVVAIFAPISSILLSGWFLAVPLAMKAADETPVENIDLDNKFRGIIFGTHAGMIHGLVPIRKSADGRYICYKRSGEQPVYNGMPIKLIEYRFLDGVFIEGLVWPPEQDEADAARLRIAAAKTYGATFNYGTPFENGGSPEAASPQGWFGNRVMACMHVNFSASFGYVLVVRNRNLYLRIRAWRYLLPQSAPERSWEL